MKRYALTLLVIAAGTWLFAAPGTQAGWFGIGKDKEDQDKDPAPRYDNYPTMSFHLGTLTRSGYGGWKLDDLQVQFRPDCEVNDQSGELGTLAEGRQALVSGARVGDTILAIRVTVLKPGWDLGPKNADQEVDWSQTDPTVGVGTGPL